MAQHCGHIQQLVELGIVGPTVTVTELVELFGNLSHPLKLHYMAELSHENSEGLLRRQSTNTLHANLQHYKHTSQRKLWWHTSVISSSSL